MNKWKRFKSGKITATKQSDGTFAIDPSELFRIYKPLQETDQREKLATHESPHATLKNELQIRVLQTELAAARDRIEDMKQQVTDLKEDRDHWRQQANRLLAAPNGKGFWDRIFGKDYAT